MFNGGGVIDSFQTWKEVVYFDIFERILQTLEFIPETFFKSRESFQAQLIV